MADNNFQEIVGTMMKGMEGFLSSKTVVGEPTQIGDTTIIPLVDVLVIKNGQIKLVNIKNQDSMTKVLDMIPDLVERFTAPKENMPSNDDAIKAAFPEDDLK